MKRTARTTAQSPRRRQILDAALGCFLESGFEGTTIEQIRHASGASHGSIYHHFRNKEAVALGLFEEGMHAYQQTVLARVVETRSAEAGIRALIAAHLEWVEANPALSRFLTRMGTAEFSEDTVARVAEVNQEFFRAVHSWLRPYIERGVVVRLPAALYVPLLLGPAAHYARHWLAERLAMDRGEVAAVLARAAWRSVRQGKEPSQNRR